MKTGWYIFFTVTFILTTIISTVGEMVWVGSEVAPLFIALNPFRYGASAWVTAIADIVLFRYTFFSGGWILVRWIFFLPISVGFIICLAISLAQGIASAVGGVFRAIRPL